MSIAEVRSKLLDAFNVMALSPKPLQERLADAYRCAIESISVDELRDELRRHFVFLVTYLAPTGEKSVEDVCNALGDDEAAALAMRLKTLFEEVDNAWIAFRAAEKQAA